MKTVARLSGWVMPIALVTLVTISGLGLYSVLLGSRSAEVEIVQDNVAAEAPQHPVIRLTAKLSGRLAEIFVVAGDRVDRGQVLAKLDTSVLVAESRAIDAQINYLEMQLYYARATANLQDGMQVEKPAAAFNTLSVDPQVYELFANNSALIGTEQEPALLAQARMDTIAAALEASRARLSYTVDQIESSTIVSPVNGKIILVVADVGQYLDSDHGLLMVSDDEQ